MLQKDYARIFKYLSYASAFIVVTFLAGIIAYITIKGAVHINLDLFSPVYTSDNLSLVPALVNTFSLTVISLLIGFPIGLAAAIYMCEYAPATSKLIAVLRLTIQTLAGVPSIVYGLFGYLFFVIFLGFGFSVISGAFTLSIMILPIIISTCEEALLAVPRSYREGSYALGAGKARTIFKIVLPCAMRGISEGIILSIGRIVGESAALIYTAGTVAQISLEGSGRTLAIHMYALWSEGLAREQSYATAFVLLVIVLGINYLSRKLVTKKSS